MAEPDLVSLGWEPERLRRAARFLDEAAARGDLPSAALCVGRRGAIVGPFAAGAARPDTRFLVASLTKPVVAAGVMTLVEDGALTLDHRVAAIVPEFQGDGKELVRIRHLLNHTSGLPDQLPNNVELRRAGSPLSAFVAGACRQPLLFRPGTEVKYQSMGFALLAEIVARVAGISLSDLLRERIFRPLAMDATALGVGPDEAAAVAPVRLDRDADAADWSWNTPYWLGLGAPWGGLVTTAGDLGRFCLMILNGGTLGGVRVLSAASIRAMLSNQLAGLPDVPEEERRCRPWGLGWRLNWPGQSANFGDLLGPRAAGHWGATGTLLWVDPDADAFAVVLTTRPQGEGGDLLARTSNLVAAALL